MFTKKNVGWVSFSVTQRIGAVASVPYPVAMLLSPSLAVGRIGSLPVATLPPSLAVGRIGSLPIATLPPSLAVGRIGSLPIATLPPSLAVVNVGLR
jgi:hypothetical protein